MGEGKSDTAGPCSALRFVLCKGSSPVGKVSGYDFRAGASVVSLSMGYGCPRAAAALPGGHKEGRKVAGSSLQPCVPSVVG